MKDSFLSRFRSDNRTAIEQEHENSRLIEQLVALRKQQGLTQAEVAARMGVDKGRVSRIEAPHISLNLTQDTLMSYAEAVGAFITYTVTPVASLNLTATATGAVGKRGIGGSGVGTAAE